MRSVDFPRRPVRVEPPSFVKRRGVRSGMCRGGRVMEKRQQEERLIWGKDSPAAHGQTAGLRGDLGLPPPKRHLHPPSPLSATLFGKSRRRPQRITQEGRARTQASNSAFISNSLCLTGQDLPWPRHPALQANKNSSGAQGPGLPALSSGGPASQRQQTESTCNINTANKEAPPKHP